MSEVMTGAWTAYSTTISAAQKSLLEKAVGIGVSYSPFAVSTQSTAVTKYRILCNTKVVRPGAPIEAKLVQFYVEHGTETPQGLEIQNVPCK